ncbi:hypothetical protein GCM10025857_08400 [Alicyclobacillus contaminans]|nr:hypothetical protein GCM10025857_08400 [Alicyclobacillus contaminans]
MRKKPWTKALGLCVVFAAVVAVGCLIDHFFFSLSSIPIGKYVASYPSQVLKKNVGPPRPLFVRFRAAPSFHVPAFTSSAAWHPASY